MTDRENAGRVQKAEPAAPPEANADYLFRFDRVLEPIVFGSECELSGWLLHRAGEPIHGLRALVRRKLSRKKVVRARRKRNRPDVASAFPDLPGAEASGFLFELPLGLGRHHFEFQLLDHARRWQTFATANVTAFPMKTLARARLLHTRGFFIGYFKRRVAARKSEAHDSTHLAPPSSVAVAQLPARVDLFATSKSNLFILEIGALVAAGFRELGCDARLCLDEIPSENPPADTLQIVVTPHEFYNLFLSEKLPRERMRGLTRKVHLLCTEQPETGWFQSNLQWAHYSIGTADINPLGVAAYRARGLRAHQLQLGYHEILSHRERIPHHRRSNDIVFLGSMTPRREEFFAQHAGFFARHQCHLRLVPLEFAKTKATRSYLSAERRNELLADARIVLNLHYSEQKYFEWHRMLVALANGCCIISETCQGHGRLVPGKHFIMVEPEQIIPACEYFLAHPGECETIAEQGRKFVETELRQAQSCAQFLRDIGGGRDGAAALELALDHPPEPLPKALRKLIARRTRRGFIQALQQDLGVWLSKENTVATKAHVLAPIPEERPAVIQKREAYRARRARQEEGRARGEAVWNLHDNPAFLRCPAPKLSVVITLYNYAQHIEGCVASITAAFARLAQPAEIVIVNDASSDESLERALQIQAKTEVPVRIVDKQFNTGLADARNVGIQIARAPYVFMMDADNLIFPDALRQLLQAITANEAAAAFSLLVRFRGSPENRVGLLSYFDWDPQILVQYPYIDAMALFRREALLEVGGYDNELSQIGWFGWEDYDMWLKFAQRKDRVAFVPNTLCLYRHHDTSMINTTNLFELELVQHFIARYGGLLRSFEPRAKVFGIAREKLAGQNIPRASNRRRFLIASGCSIATTHLYRCIHLQEQLQQLGHEAEVVDWSNEARFDPAQARGYDALFLYRLPLSPPLERVMEEARAADVPVIFDTDDLIFEPDLVEAQRGVQKLSESEQRQHIEGVRRYLGTLLAADAVTVATPFLAELAGQRGKSAYVHRNSLGDEMLAVAERWRVQRAASLTSDRVVIGYGSGTPTHDFDFREAAPALEKILMRFPAAQLWIAGPLDLPVEFSSFGARVRRLPLTDWRGWFRVLSQCDIALAPLEAENVFCRAKSEIKFVEAGALGVPLVASRSEPFTAAITDGENGLLARGEEEWTSALTSLVDDPERRARIGARARETILQRYTPETRAAGLEKLLPHLLEAGRVASAAPVAP